MRPFQIHPEGLKGILKEKIASMDLKLIISGIGGRGVLFATRIIAEAARDCNLPVLISETHGMSQRGGSVVSHIKIGPAESPVIMMGTADILIGLERQEGIKNLSALRDGGKAILNSSQPDLGNKELADRLRQKGIELFFINADKEAAEAGYALAANMVALGFLAGIASRELKDIDLRHGVELLSPEDYLEPNLKTFARGEELARLLSRRSGEGGQGRQEAALS